MIAQRIRNRIIETLELASSFEAQIEYQRFAPIHVPHEVVNGWEDWAGLPLSSVHYDPVFAEEERGAIVRYSETLNEVCRATPDPLPPLDELLSDPQWHRLRASAADALAIFQVRGKLPDDEIP